jgi:hypothetical protein
MTDGAKTEAAMASPAGKVLTAAGLTPYRDCWRKDVGEAYYLIANPVEGIGLMTDVANPDAGVRSTVSSSAAPT